MASRSWFDEGLLAKARADFVTVSEPAVGAGAMLIAFAEVMRQRGVEPQHHLHITAQDIDRKAACMAYTQLSLLGLPAVVIVGDTLRMTCSEVWYTPAHILGGWTARLERRRGTDGIAGAIELARSAVVEVSGPSDTTRLAPEQLSLLG